MENDVLICSCIVIVNGFTLPVLSFIRFNLYSWRMCLWQILMHSNSFCIWYSVFSSPTSYFSLIWEFSPIFYTALILLPIAFFWHSFYLPVKCKSICSINFYTMWSMSGGKGRETLFSMFFACYNGAMGQMEHDSKDNDYATLHFGNRHYVSYCVLCSAQCKSYVELLCSYSVLIFPFLLLTPHILCST